MGKKKYAQKKLAKPPGYLLYTGENVDEPMSIDAILVSESSIVEKDKVKLADIPALIESNETVWLNVNGLAEVDKIAQIGEMLKLHPLTMEDIVNIGARPKYEEFENYLLVGLKMMYYKEEKLVVEHLSFILVENCVISFQEIKEDVFEGIRLRLREGKGRIRKAGADYLLYTLVDAVVDHYFIVFENYGDRIEDLENEIFEDAENTVAMKIQRLKREIFKMRKALFPMREVVNRLERSENELIQDSTKPFIRDVHNHNVQLIETVENYRDMTMGLMDLYMTGISNKMNNVMKVLTIISTIFIPLTFMAGIYGMNFEYMPELGYRYAYFILWGVMVIMFLVMIYLFKKRNWL